jgi:tetratricopeptide (TPR) repeat protein
MRAPNELSRSSGTTLREQGRYDEAAAALEKAITIVRAARGDDHPLMAMVLMNRARVHMARGEARAAAPLFERALLIRQHAYPEDDWRIAAAKSYLGGVRTALARYQEAEALLVDAHRVLKDEGASQKDARANITRLIALYEAWGRPDQAAIYRLSSRPGNPSSRSVSTSGSPAK